MTLTIELTPEQERRVREAAARAGIPLETFAREAIAGRADAETNPEATRLAELLARWNLEDAADPDADPIWEIPRLSLREHRTDA